MKLFLKNSYFLIYLAGLGLLILANSKGIGFTYDSYDYQGASQQIFYFLSGKSNIIRPPIFPIVLSIFSVFGIAGYFILSLFCFSISSWIFHALIASTITNYYVKTYIFSLFIFSISLHLTHSFLWTEPLMILWILLFIWILISKFNYGILLLLAILMVLTKNGSMLLIPFLAAGIWWMNRSWKGFFYSFVMILTCAIVYELWNQHIGRPEMIETVARVRFFSFTYLEVLLGWFVPISFPLWAQIMAFSGFTIGFALVATGFDNQTQFFALVFCGYLVLRMYYAHVDYHESERYMSIAYPVLLLVIGKLTDQRKLDFTTLSLYSVWLLYSIIRVVKNDIIWFIER